MPQTPRIARALNHVAYLTSDSEATRRFYTEVMGFELAAAVRGDYDPESRRKLPHLHTFFAMGSGEIIAFFELDGIEPPPPEAHIPRWARHIALAVDSQEELLAWKRRLEEKGLDVHGVVDHFGTWYSIYFSDPNGVLLELTHQARELNDEDARQAEEMLRQWNAEHGRGG